MAAEIPRREILKGALVAGVSLAGLSGDASPSVPLGMAHPPKTEIAPKLPTHNVEINTLPVLYDYDYRFPMTEAFSGGDGGFSCQLPDGRTVIVYSDTAKGGVEQPDGKGRLPRKPGAYFVNNSAIIVDEEKGTYSVLSGLKDNDGHDTSWIVPPEAEEENSYYWQQTPTVANGKLYIPMSRESRNTQQANAIAGTTIGIDIARYDVSGEFPVLEAITPLPRNEDPEHTRSISWGAGIVNDPDQNFTYVYGSKRQPDESKALYVARVPMGQLDHPDSWQFWQGEDWVQGPFKQAEAQASVILGADQGLSAGFSVDVIDGQIVIVSKDTESMTDKIAAFTADTFNGPWEKREIYTIPNPNTPSNPHAIDPKNGQIVSYLASAHPEAFNPNRPTDMLVTYCSNVIPTLEFPQANTLVAHAADAELSRTKSVWIPRGALGKSVLD